MDSHSTPIVSLADHESGVTSIEYALIVGLLALTIIGALGDVGGALAAFFTTLSTGLVL